MDTALEDHFTTSRILVRRRFKDVGAIDYALRTGQLEAVLPGVYAQKGHRAFPEVRVAALGAYEPRAVLLANAAARFSFWPARPIETVIAAVPRRLSPQPGFRFVRRTVPDDLVAVVDDVRVAVPALAAIEAGPAVVDYALRESKVTLDELWSAYEATKRWRGASTRRQLVEESSDNPWSAAERQLHRLLRGAGLTDWRGNYPIGDHPVDVVFPRQRLAIEVDGRHFHGDANFEKDRWQQNAVVLAGWRVLRFTWTMIESYPERVIETVRQALSQELPTATAARAARPAAAGAARSRG